MKRTVILVTDNKKKQLADKLGISPDSVKYCLKKLKGTGRIEHQGSTKAGKWVVLK